MDSTLLTTADLAKRFQVPPETVRSWRYTGAGPHWIKLGRHVRYRAEDVDAWLAQHEQASASSAG